ncbi:amidase signature domain-containing protein [Gymnopilus junonius]|uniref:Amidase signature domain-containing protein n=1 Tax=Gymnopilus junonius TaxID=109634 RepID=A0A9P5TGX2_GYMJU|nr:amidase signature domain-containing protein [Gymnopilus junonius]
MCHLKLWLFALLALGAMQVISTAAFAFPDLYKASIAELQAGLDGGHFTSVDLIKAYFARIEEVNLKGPALHAILETNPSAIVQAAVLDKERKITGKRSALHGIPILLKREDGNLLPEFQDNIATIASEGLNTTAGSFSLLGSVVPEDAGVVKCLRKAGAIILVSLGTETDGSITCPTSNNNLTGIKPTVGLTSWAGVVPISKHQDTVGPMTRSVTDAVIVLSIIAGRDPNDNFTFAQPPIVPDFTKALNKNALKGKRIGVPRRAFLNDSISGNDPFINVVFEQALATI